MPNSVTQTQDHFVFVYSIIFLLLWQSTTIKGTDEMKTLFEIIISEE